MSTATFKKTCDQCQMTTINGYRAHELGCPNAWKNRRIDCFQCGFEFQPTSVHDKVCQACRNSENDPHEED